MTPLLDERLHDYLDGRLAPAERALLERALAADPELARALDLLRATSRAFRELPLVPAPASLRAAIERDVEAACHAFPARVHRLFRSLDRSLLAASLVGALVVGGALVVSWGPSDPSGVRDVLASGPVDTREVKVGLVEVDVPPSEPALAFVETDKKPAETAKAFGADDARLRAGKPEDVNDHAEEVVKGSGEGAAAVLEKQPQEKPSSGLELERLKDLERQKQLLELQQRGQATQPATNADPTSKDVPQVGADAPKAPLNTPAPPAPSKAGARPADDPGRSKDGPEEEKAREGDLKDKFKADAQDLDGKNTKALGEPATPESRRQPTPAGDPAPDAAKTMEGGLGSAGAPGGSADGGQGGGENAERLARRHRLAQDRAAREAGNKAAGDGEDGARRAAHASCRPLELVSADPERIAVLLQSHAEREGLAIRREQVEGGWVVELEDLSLAQAERLRSATRELAPSDEAERARWGFAGRSDADRGALKKAEAPEASATSGAPRTGKPGSPQAEGDAGAGGATVAPPATQPTPKSAPPRDEHTGAPPTVAPPKADAPSDGRPKADEPRQGEHGGKRAEHPGDAPSEAAPPSEEPSGVGGDSRAGEKRPGDLAEDALELRARQLTATEKLRSLEKGLTDVARDARKELDAERNESADQDRPLPRYSLRIVIRRH